MSEAKLGKRQVLKWYNSRGNKFPPGGMFGYSGTVRGCAYINGHNWCCT